MRLTPLMAATLLAMPLLSPPAQAAEDYDSCTGFIDAVPFDVTEGGTWCMRSDLVYDGSTGEAGIRIMARNVIVDCNHHRLSGAGETIPQWGILNSSQRNLTVRNCDLDNFQIPIFVRGDALVIEDNRISRGRERGMFVAGYNNTVRRNIVLDTGNDTQFIGWAMGISAFGEVDVLDNTVAGVASTAGSDERAWGIFVNWENAETDSHSIVGNRVRDVAADGTGEAIGITAASPGNVVIRNNVVVVPDADIGVYCPYLTKSRVSENVVLGPTLPVHGCPESTGNIVKN